MRGEEHIKLRHCFPNDWGIQGVGFIPGTSVPATASASTIQEQAPNDVQQNVFGQPTSAPEVFVPITAQDLLLQSAAAKGALNHRAQISVGGLWNICNVQILAGFGGYIELPQYNSDLDRWGIWAKLGITV